MLGVPLNGLMFGIIGLARFFMHILMIIGWNIMPVRKRSKTENYLIATVHIHSIYWRETWISESRYKWWWDTQMSEFDTSSHLFSLQVTYLMFQLRSVDRLYLYAILWAKTVCKFNPVRLDQNQMLKIFNYQITLCII